MDRRTNPFHELYVTETISNEHFVNLFSPRLVENTLPIFLPGNAVVKGVKGSGKSMLLALLKPDIRVAYKKASVAFPLSNEQSNFIGAGINLLRSGTADFGQRSFLSNPTEEAKTLPLYFGDFINYWIVEDLFRSISIFANELGGALAAELAIRCDEPTLDAFARSCSSLDCWFGYLDGIDTYSAMIKKIKRRILEYRSYLNFNIEHFPTEISSTKTSIGEPISRVVEALWQSGIIPRTVEVFIRIDQYEEMYNLEGIYKTEQYGSLFRQVINKMIGRRDPNVSYRIGTRGYAWTNNVSVYRSEASLEEGRDYKIVDLDEILSRQENTPKWAFPAFTEDVFLRRLKFAGFKPPEEPEITSLVEYVFGHGTAPEARALRYIGSGSRARAVRLDPDWPASWRKFLSGLAQSNPFSARLGEAWFRQKLGTLATGQIPTQPYPWQQDKSWRKERIEQALIQIAGACAQRPTYSGRKDIEELSGGNISVFINICQQIWAAWLRTVQKDGNHLSKIPQITEIIQSVGILEASSRYFQSIPQKLGESSARQRFVNILGVHLSKLYYEDRAMSNPGHNGISLSTVDLDQNKNVSDFLQNLSDYGELLSRPHTSKERDRIPRIKYYLNPILCPYFRLSHKHQKEPIYMQAAKVAVWIEEANGVAAPKKIDNNPSSNDLPLFQKKED